MDNPCPILKPLPLDCVVKLTIENPASSFTETWDVTSPSVFETAGPPAFQHHATYSLLAFVPSSLLVSLNPLGKILTPL